MVSSSDSLHVCSTSQVATCFRNKVSIGEHLISNPGAQDFKGGIKASSSPLKMTTLICSVPDMQEPSLQHICLSSELSSLSSNKCQQQSCCDCNQQGRSQLSLREENLLLQVPLNELQSNGLHQCLLRTEKLNETQSTLTMSIH